MKIFKMKEPICTMFHGKFQYYFREPFGTICYDGVYGEEFPSYEEVDFDLNLLKVSIKLGTSPFTGKEQKYYFFNYNNEDIYIESYDSDSETFEEKIVKQLNKNNIKYI